MFDIKDIRTRPDYYQGMMVKRGLSADVITNILELDKAFRNCITEEDTFRAKSITTKADREIGRGLKVKTDEARQVFMKAMIEVPNVIHERVPEGKTEADNTLNFESKEVEKKLGGPDHVQIAGKLLNFEKAAHVSGARFVYVMGGLAKLERALTNFMLDRHALHGFTEVSPPLMVNIDAVFGTGQYPKFENDLFKVSTDDSEKIRYLVPTAEVPLTNLVANEILNKSDLPLRFVAHTPCFRAEAGAAGKDTKGLIRMHQFNKVELVSIVENTMGLLELEWLTHYACNILQCLQLPYRVINLCAGDLGFSSLMTHDIEVWMPSQNKYREISSVSWCGDFQAHRMTARYRPTPADKPVYLHTLNASGVAVGRLMAALIETGYDGTVIKLPEALWPYYGAEFIIL